MSSPAFSPSRRYADSSPESSPVLEPIDSSPPSSPPCQPVSLSPPVSPGPAHPFAASTKAVKPLRLYEKRDIYFPDDDDFIGTSDGLLNDRDYGTHKQHGSFWGASPKKNRNTGGRHARTLSSASTSSSITDTLLGRPFAPRQLLFGAQHQSQRSTSTDSRDELASIDLSDDESHFSLPRGRARDRANQEQNIWDKAITKAVDSADGLIDLQQDGLISSGLSFIPRSIADLASLVVLPSKDSITAESSKHPRIRPFARAITFPAKSDAPFLVSSKFASARSTSMGLGDPTRPSHPTVMNEVNLLLGNNFITKLPLELFVLDNLTVLSMRNNLLTRIPPQITLLRNLRELNVAQNRLTYLPAEMLEMSLDGLVVDRNPWLEFSFASGSSGGAQAPPSKPLQRTAHSSTTQQPLVSSTTMHFKMPTLTECCLRVLLAPRIEPSQALNAHTISPRKFRLRTRLEAMYELPLSNIDHYPSALVKTLRACVPQAVAKPDPDLRGSPSKKPRRSSTRSRVSSTLNDVFFAPASSAPVVAEPATDSDEETHPGIGTCMSSSHPRHARPVFVAPAEERFQWVRTVAGQPVHEDVPVLWRGCMPGCLSFLGEEQEDPPDEAEAQHDRQEDAGTLSDGGGIEQINLVGGLGDEFD